MDMNEDEINETELKRLCVAINWLTYKEREVAQNDLDMKVQQKVELKTSPT